MRIQSHKVTVTKHSFLQETVASWFPEYELPLLSERVKCLRELGHVLKQGASDHFQTLIYLTST